MGRTGGEGETKNGVEGADVEERERERERESGTTMTEGYNYGG